MRDLAVALAVGLGAVLRGDFAGEQGPEAVLLEADADGLFLRVGDGTRGRALGLADVLLARPGHLGRVGPPRAGEVSGYYGPGSGIGRVFASRGSTPIRVGIVGLGAGVLAAFCRPGDSFHYYEIDPLIYDVAREWFDFLKR